MSAVEIFQVEKRFGRVRALAGVSTAIPSGRLTLVSGPNGAGKSTLLRVLAALCRPTRGSVRVLDQELFRHGASAVRGRIGYLGPEPGLYGELTVRENLAYCARIGGVAANRIDPALAWIHLEDVAHRRARALSTGFQRRAGLARAFLGAPDLVLLDEPWNALDADAADLLARRLAQHRERGRTAIVAAHTIGAYANLFDHTLRLEAGRLEPPGAA